MKNTLVLFPAGVSPSHGTVGKSCLPAGGEQKKKWRKTTTTTATTKKTSSFFAATREKREGLLCNPGKGSRLSKCVSLTPADGPTGSLGGSADLESCDQPSSTAFGGTGKPRFFLSPP